MRPHYTYQKFDDTCSFTTTLFHFPLVLYSTTNENWSLEAKVCQEKPLNGRPYAKKGPQFTIY